MCGIIGEIALNRKNITTSKKNISSGLTTMASRGPDYSAIKKTNKLIFGHSRLSIIDTSKNSNQPMKKDNFIIVFNGEIYNYKKLKQELIKLGASFKTSGDTEVIIESYRHWGDKCVSKFEGMWAFAIFNTKNNIGLISRDPIGQKPLVYTYKDNRIYFASELPALLKIINKPNPNWHALSNFNLYNFRHIPAPYTAFQDVYKLKPGHNITIDGKIKIKKYRSNAKITKKLSIEIDKAIDLVKVSDTKVGLMLSGGIDSSLIAERLRDLDTYSIGQSKQDPELIRSKNVSNKLKLKNKSTIFDNSKNKSFLNHNNNIFCFGEPIYLEQIGYLKSILKQMNKDGIKVAIGGNGADEIFYGYDGARKLYWISLLRNILIKKPLKFLISYVPFLNNIVSPAYEIKSKLYQSKIDKKKYIKPEYRKFIYSDIFRDISSEINSDNLIDIFNWLGLRIENEHSITIVGDLAGSMSSVEVRTPFLSNSIIKFAMSLPAYSKIGIFSNKNKKPLRKLVEDRLDKETANYSKMGFGHNINRNQFIFKNYNQISKIILKNIDKIDIYESKIIRNMISSKKDFEANYQQIFEIYLVCKWFQNNYQ
tara:strand:- start:96 stop:1877 length:1782 start_codon:yes stop_codon:yes gene_type:complete